MKNLHFVKGKYYKSQMKLQVMIMQQDLYGYCPVRAIEIEELEIKLQDLAREVVKVQIFEEHHITATTKDLAEMCLERLEIPNQL